MKSTDADKESQWSRFTKFSSEIGSKISIFISIQSLMMAGEVGAGGPDNRWDVQHILKLSRSPIRSQEGSQNPDCLYESLCTSQDLSRNRVSDGRLF